MLVEKVLKTIKKYKLLEEGDKVVVGLSGGPDSVCLLHILYALKEMLNINIYPIHINHMLREEESFRDEKYVEDLCKKLGFGAEIKRIDIKLYAIEKGLSLEEAGRECRYREFEELLRLKNGTKIAVAHNKNDQAETVLLRILRGTGISGLQGMDFQRDNIIRPLLDIQRVEIEDYCEINKLSPITDSSNLQTIYTRNKIRLELIPQIDKMFDTNITDNLFRMSRLLREDSKIIEKVISSKYEEIVLSKNDQEINLNFEELMAKEDGLIARILRMAISYIKGDLKGIAYEHIIGAINILRQGNSGAVVELPQNIRIKRQYEKVIIYKKKIIEETPLNELLLGIPGENAILDNNSVILASVLNKKCCENYCYKNEEKFIGYFDFDLIKEGITIRNRKNGDVFKPFKSNGTKKLKEYFIDKKIPIEVRNKKILIAKNAEIIWVVGDVISDKFKVTDNTKIVLKLEYKTN